MAGKQLPGIQGVPSVSARAGDKGRRHEQFHHPAWRRSHPHAAARPPGRRAPASSPPTPASATPPLLGLTPELWVGDFDSVPANLPDAWPLCRAQVFPAEKDKTDGELAIACRARTRRDQPRACRRFRRQARRSRLPASDARPAAGRSGTGRCCLTSGAQEGHPAAAGKGRLRLCRRHAVFRARLLRSLRADRHRRANGRSNHVEVAFGSSLTISNEVKGRLEIAAEAAAARCCSPILSRLPKF